MQAIANLYPPLDVRAQIPGFLAPAAFALTLLPFFTPHRRRTALLILPILLSACVIAPRYTFGNPSADFYRSSTFIIIPLWFIDFAICRPEHGVEAPVYVGQKSQVKKETKCGKGIEDCKTLWEKLWWAGELMIPSHRGIGWNWQIKNVPVDPDTNLPRWRWIANHGARATASYLGSVCMLVIVGLVTALEEQEINNARTVTSFMIDAVIGWSVAVWIYLRLTTFYSASAALAVTLRVYDPWQLPPLMGSAKDVWSARQFWATYHQTMRQMVSQPALRCTRLFGCRKGTLVSSLAQVYLAFGVSCLVHQYQMFNVTRRDMGEFAFFMGQPVAISIEGGVQWVWRRYVRQSARRKPWEAIIGYAWVFFWLSLTLPIYLKGMVDTGIVVDAFLEDIPVRYSTIIAKEALSLDKKY